MLPALARRIAYSSGSSIARSIATSAASWRRAPSPFPGAPCCAGATPQPPNHPRGLVAYETRSAAAPMATPQDLITIEVVPPAACGMGEEGALDGDSGVRLLRLNNTNGALNSLTVEMAEAFEALFGGLMADKAMRALVMTGEGRAFSAGGDFGFIADRQRGDVADNKRVLARFYTTFLALQRLPVPTIAAINGPAVGGGMGLAMSCDIRVASTAAKMSFNFVKLGLTPGMASSTVLPAATSHQVACRLLLTGDLVGAEEARELGLVLQVVPPEELLPTALALAGRIAAASPTAVTGTLAMLRARLPWEQLRAAAEEEAESQAEFFKRVDCREGVDSVKGKRRAVFQPRLQD